jgi:hypothetical protein
VRVDLDRKTVAVKTAPPPAVVAGAIEGAGYPPAQPAG